MKRSKKLLVAVLLFIAAAVFITLSFRGSLCAVVAGAVTITIACYITDDALFGDYDEPDDYYHNDILQ